MGWSSGTGWVGVRLLTSPVISGNVLPASNDGGAIGSATLSFSDLFLASGGVINWNNGDVTITHASNTLTVGGGNLALGNNDITGIGDGSTVQLGTSSSTGTLCAFASVNTTAVGNVGAGEDDLMSYSLPANALATNGAFVEVLAEFTMAANASSKTIIFYFGATSVELTAAGNNITVDALGRVIRTGATTQSMTVSSIYSNGGADTIRATPAETLSGAITMKFTGGATTTDDIIQRSMIVRVWNPPA